jgi:hypothetical protein
VLVVAAIAHLVVAFGMRVAVVRVAIYQAQRL